MGSVVVEERCSSSLQDAAFTSFGGTVAKDGLALGGYRRCIVHHRVFTVAPSNGRLMLLDGDA